MTGIRAATVKRTMRLDVGSRLLSHARVFADVPQGEVFWYENSIGLIEIAANRASAAAILDLKVGQIIDLEVPA